MPSHNEIILAAAGTGKTTQLVERIGQLENKRILVTTYTDENTKLIKSLLYKKYGFLPPNILVLSWYTFLLRDGIRPFQNCLDIKARIESIAWINKKLYHKKYDFITQGNRVYRDKAAEFICECNTASRGALIRRLESIYDYIFIDEMQDLTGYDLAFLELLFNSKISIWGVGDPRQSILRTNYALKNKQYSKEALIKWLKQQEKAGKLTLEEMNTCYRCRPSICDFANKIFPDYPLMVSGNSSIVEAEGIVMIPLDQVDDYIRRYQPVILRKWIKTDTKGYSAINIGVAKGKTFERVLLFPTQTMLRFIKNPQDNDNFKEKELLYVAITRAKYSVAVVDASV